MENSSSNQFNKIEKWVYQLNSDYLSLLNKVLKRLLYEQNITGKSDFYLALDLLNVISDNHYDEIFDALAEKKILFIDKNPKILAKGFTVMNNLINIKVNQLTKQAQELIEEKLIQGEDDKKASLTTVRKTYTRPFKNWIQKGKIGILILEDGTHHKFWGSNYGGLDLLFRNFGKEVTAEELKKAIRSGSTDKNMLISKISISAWKSNLKRKRKIFAKYFDIESISKNTYRLIGIS